MKNLIEALKQKRDEIIENDEFSNGIKEGYSRAIELITETNGVKGQMEENSIPSWLTPEVRSLAKKTWNEHENVNDRKRVMAMRIVQKGALDAGYTIGIQKSLDLLKEFCLD